MKRIKILVISLMALGVGSLGVMQFAPLVSAGTAASEACEGLGGRYVRGECIVSDGGSSVESIVATVVNVLSIIVGIVAVIMIIFGGFRYITAAGDSSKISSARNTIVYAIVGLVIVALAQFIVQFVVQRATGTEIEEDTSLMIASSLTRNF